MKKICTCALCLGLMNFSSIPMSAQSLSSVERGDSVVLKAPDGYCSYQWQVSSDQKFFVDIPNGNKQNYALQANVPAFYRVKVKDESAKISYLDTLNVRMRPITYHPNFSISGGGHGYVETVDGQLNVKGINIPEDRVNGVAGTEKKLTSWVSGEAMAVYYFNHPVSIVDTEMLLKLRAGSKVAFRVKVFDPSKMDQPIADNIVALRGTGAEQKVPLVSARFHKKKYYRYQIQCLEGWNSIIEISKFYHHAPYNYPTYKAAFRSSPSVHLGGWKSTDPGAPQGNNYDWCYQEVMMPKESDILGTYIMSLGVLSGYMGIQVNGYDEEGPIHGILFSMWDDGSTDKDPNLPDYRRACALDKGEDVVAKRFGHEGTGIQTFKHGHYWNTDTYVQFITHCQQETAYYYVEENGEKRRVEQHNTLVSAWYNAQDGKGWRYMATLRVPNKNKYFGSWYSFLENYNAATGQAERKGFYRNGYARDRFSKTWFHCNSVKFGHTDGGTKIGSRYDFSQGASAEEEGAFVMATGGYVDSVITAKTVPLNKVNLPVDTINLAVLEAREEQAIAHEKTMIEEEELFDKQRLNKQGWKVVDFSSEETKTQDNNGRAALIIDGNADTYWHSRWKGQKAQYPHHLTVDMGTSYTMKGMEILMSGGSKRYLKSFDLYVSDDNSTWKKVHSDSDAPDREKFRFILQTPVEARFFKLVITDGRATDGAHVRINEIDVSGVPVETGIGSSLGSDNGMTVVCRQQEMNVSVGQNLAHAQLALYAVDGTCVFSDTLENWKQGEVVHIPMGGFPEGVYVLSCTTDETKIAKSVLWHK